MFDTRHDILENLGFVLDYDDFKSGLTWQDAFHNAYNMFKMENISIPKLGIKDPFEEKAVKELKTFKPDEKLDPWNVGYDGVLGAQNLVEGIDLTGKINLKKEDSLWFLNPELLVYYVNYIRVQYALNQILQKLDIGTAITSDALKQVKAETQKELQEAE